MSRTADADILFALPLCQQGELLDAIATDLTARLKARGQEVRAVVLYPDQTVIAPSDELDIDSGSRELLSEKQEGVDADSTLRLLPHRFPPGELRGQQRTEQALRSVLPVAKALGVRACVLLGSDATAATASDLLSLAEPVLNEGYDLAAPVYAHDEYSALVNSAIIYPLTKALYGAGLRYPMAVSCALSARLADQYLQPPQLGQNQSERVAIKAICGGMQISQVHWNAPPPSAGPEAADLSTSLAQVLGGYFSELERYAAFWQKIHNSQPVRTFGKPAPPTREAAAVDVLPMVQAFQRGCRDLLEIWTVVLSPAALVELRKLAKQPPAEFRLRNELWAQLIYDSIVGYKHRMISREHLLRSMTPLYLGWVASYALEHQRSPVNRDDVQIEALCIAFERLKPYLLARWRSPDRFNS